MTRKDYELIVGAILAARYDAMTGKPGLMPLADTDATIDIVAECLADALESEHKRNTFNRAKFLKHASSNRS